MLRPHHAEGVKSNLHYPIKKCVGANDTEDAIMANITKAKRDEMLAFLEKLKQQHTDDISIKAFNEIENHLIEKKFGLVFEEHTEEVDEKLKDNIPVLCSDETRRLCKNEALPWNFIIEGDNLQAFIFLKRHIMVR